MPAIVVQSSKLSSVFLKRKPVAHFKGLSSETARASATNQPLSHSGVADVLTGGPSIFPSDPLVPVTLSTKRSKQFYVQFSPWTTW